MSSGALPPTPTSMTPVAVAASAPAPVLKRKRRTSQLGEQERRERKRAIDREAQRSLREKTKTHIADLERTISILRNEDRDGTIANLLQEVEALRAENDRLKDVIDGVRSVVGGGVANRRGSIRSVGEIAVKRDPSHAPSLQATASDTSPSQLAIQTNFPLAEPDVTVRTHSQSSVAIDSRSRRIATSKTTRRASIPSRNIDLDGMVLSPLPSTEHGSPMTLYPKPETVSESVQGDFQIADRADSPATASYAPLNMGGRGDYALAPKDRHWRTRQRHGS